jgi:hypothetical protein
MDCYALLFDSINQCVGANTRKSGGAGVCTIVIHFYEASLQKSLHVLSFNQLRMFAVRAWSPIAFAADFPRPPFRPSKE